MLLWGLNQVRTGKTCKIGTVFCALSPIQPGLYLPSGQRAQALKSGDPFPPKGSSKILNRHPDLCRSVKNIPNKESASWPPRICDYVALNDKGVCRCDQGYKPWDGEHTIDYPGGPMSPFLAMVRMKRKNKEKQRWKESDKKLERDSILPGRVTEVKGCRWSLEAGKDKEVDRSSSRASKRDIILPINTRRPVRQNRTTEWGRRRGKREGSTSKIKHMT